MPRFDQLDRRRAILFFYGQQVLGVSFVLTLALLPHFGGAMSTP